MSGKQQQESGCKEIDENTGKKCGESESLSILDKFQQLYKARLDHVNESMENDTDRLEIKFQITMDWIKDLTQQNEMLVSTVEDLEKAARDRVLLLEDKLELSSNLVTQNISQSNNSKDTLRALESRVKSLENDEKSMQKKIECLQCDVEGLLELIRRARRENRWSLDGIRFCEIRPSDIPTPLECKCDQLIVRNDFEYLKKLEEKEKQTLSSKENLKKKLKNSAVNLIEFKSRLKRLGTIVEKHWNESLNATHNDSISEFDYYIQLIESLTNKEDLAKQLDKKIILLEERIKNSDMQTRFKDDIIKELRKKIKRTNTEEEDEGSQLKNFKYNLEKELKDLENLKGQLHSKDLAVEIIEGISTRKKKDIVRLNDIIEKPKYNLEAVIERFKLMDEFRLCTVEAQAATEDIREEINRILSTLNIQQEKHGELIKVIKNLHKFLETAQSCGEEVLLGLEGQEEERNRYAERVVREEENLKDLKNQLNEELLELIPERMDRVIDIVRGFKDVGRCTKITLNRFKEKFVGIDSNLKLLRKEAEEILTDNRDLYTTLVQKDKKLNKLELEIDDAHTRMQGVLESLIDMKEEEEEYGTVVDTRCPKITDKILKAKSDVYNLKKEHEDFKCKTLAEIGRMKSENCANEWKHKFADLQEQVGKLENEVILKETSNNNLKRRLKSVQEEYLLDEKKSWTKCMELRKRVVELERSKNPKVEVPWLLKTLQDDIQSTRNDLTDIEHELESLGREIPESTSLRLIDKFKRYQEKINNCFTEIGIIEEAFDSKHKLVGNLDETIRLQKDSIDRSETELISLRQQLQDKIIQHTKDREQLSNENKLQMETIGHLQTALVEAKKSLDHVGHKTLTDLVRRDQLIRTLAAYVDETQTQFNDCFAEAARQDSLMELQRDAIEILNNKLEDQCCNNKSIHSMYYFILSVLREDMELRAVDLETLKLKFEALVLSKRTLKNNYMEIEKYWEAVSNELEKLKKLQLEKLDKDCQCDDTRELIKDLKNLEIRLAESQDDKLKGTKRFEETITTLKNDLQLTKLREKELKSEEHAILQKDNEQLQMKLEKIKESLVSMETSYRTELLDVGNEKTILGKAVDKLKEELILKNSELDKSLEFNRVLKEEKDQIEETNRRCKTELEDTHDSLYKLKEECKWKNKSLKSMCLELRKTAISRSQLCKESQQMVTSIRVWMDEQNKIINNLSEKLRILRTMVKELKRENIICKQKLRTKKSDSFWYPQFKLISEALRNDMNSSTTTSTTEKSMDENRDHGYLSSASK